MDPHLFAAIRHRPAPTSRPRVPVRRASSLLAGVSDAERLEKALRRLEQLEPLIQKVQRSAVPFSAARGAPEVRAKLAEAKAAEAAARLVPVMEGNKETNSEEVDAFFDSTNELKRLVEVELFATRLDRLNYFVHTLTSLGNQFAQIRISTFPKPQQATLRGILDGVTVLAENDHSHDSNEQLVNLTEVVAAFVVQFNQILWPQANSYTPPPPAAPEVPPRSSRRPQPPTSGEGSHQRGASFSLGHAHEPQMGGRQALIHGVSARRLQARYGY